MKKILSIILALAVLTVGFSSVVSAATKEDLGGGVYVIDGASAFSAYSSVTPTLNVEVTQLENSTQVSPLLNSAFTLSQWNFETYDIYKVEATLSNLGELVNGYSSSFEPVRRGVASFTVTFPSTAFAKSDVKKTQIANGNLQVGTDLGTGDFNIQWGATDTENPYPWFDTTSTDSQYVADGSFSFAFVVALTKGATLDVSNIATKVNYIDEGLNVLPNTNAALQSVKFPPASDVTKIETAETKSNIANGTTGLLDRDGNAATIAKNYGITKFSPTLNTATKNYFINAKDSAGKEMGKKALNFNAQNIEGKATFYVIIKSADHVISDIWIEEEDAE